MRNCCFLLISILLGVSGFSQAVAGRVESESFSPAFNAAYAACPEIPKGLLEAVAWAQTRIQHLDGHNHSCTGLPATYGVMGLTEDGQGYFRNNLKLISTLSGISVHKLKTDPKKNILGYARAFCKLYSFTDGADLWLGREITLCLLSEIPVDNNPTNQFALKSFTYEVLRFLKDPSNQSKWHFPDYGINLADIYGTENLAVLSSEKVLLSTSSVATPTGIVFTPKDRSLEYGPALWVATPSCNYSSRAGTPISAVTIHTIQGTYAGAISWAQNCDANVSYHYVARSSDGQITQMLYEADKGWHVGSENPYTIGIEHEGYVTNPAWYTEAMYTGSANLVRDITESGYGIDPLRTFQGPATSGTNVLGGCVRIKGHQHYPFQTHTDPGIYWNWEHYYQLINDDPSVTAYTASTGTFYDSGGAGGNYDDDERSLYLIQPVGAVSVTISFSAFSLEEDWDYLRVYDGNSTDDPLLGIYTGADYPTTLSSTVGEMLLEFRSDCATTDIGWNISWTSAAPSPGDVIAPSTSVDLSSSWYTADFSASFTDSDNPGGSGVDQTFFQVSDFGGTEWRSNSDQGFFNDVFDVAIHPEWTMQTGTWNITSGKLQQSNEALDNTNIWADVNQDDDDLFLYNWQQVISGSGTNKRGGFHFMCDNPTLTNRGNSYFIWLRSDNDKLQIYETVSDVFSLEVDIPWTIADNQWYDVKTVYDKSTGRIQVWIDDVFAAEWVDATPLTTGNSVSFRSGLANVKTDNLRVYHGRSSTAPVSIGSLTEEIRYQNANPSSPSAAIRSMVIDSAFNVSTVFSENANIDWTNPSTPSYLFDGTSADIATTGTGTELSANWSVALDTNSGIERYYYAIGTAPLLTDVVNWTDNWFDTTVTHTGLDLTTSTTYYFSVFAENGAGLNSDTISSDGQMLILPTGPPSADFNVYGTNVCQPDSIQFENSSSDATSYLWTVPGAVPMTSTDVNPYFFFPASGTYEVTLEASGPGGTDTIVESVAVESFEQPVADFVPNTTSTTLADPFITFSNNSENANGYYWDFADGDNSTDFEPWHEYTAAGIYNVMLIAINGTCPNDTAWVEIEVTSDLGIAENGIGMNVFPTPATDHIYISTDVSWVNEHVICQMRDVQGRLVLIMNLNGSTSPVRVDFPNGISDGVYLLSVGYGGGEHWIRRKVLVVR